MSVFLAEDLKKLAAYVPGEQPQDKRYVKLNTNENPFYPSRRAMEAITQSELENLRLYSDPDSRKLVSAIAKAYDVCEKRSSSATVRTNCSPFVSVRSGKTAPAFRT